MVLQILLPQYLVYHSSAVNLIVFIQTVHAQTSAVASSFLGSFAAQIINPFIKLLVALALIMFLWGVVEFVARSNDDTAREKGKKHIVWGIIGLFIMLSAFGILNLICNTINC